MLNLRLQTILFIFFLCFTAWAKDASTRPIHVPMSFSKTHIFPSTGTLRFELRELIEHPFYSWPRTLLTYPVDFTNASIQADQLTLINLETNRAEPFQLSQVETSNGKLKFALVHFFSDLPSGATRRFELRTGNTPATSSRMEAKEETDTIVLDTGITRVRIPTSREVWGDAPGPIMQLGWGDRWYGSSRVVSPNRRLKRIITKSGEVGPLFIDYFVTYEFERGGHYRAQLRAIRGYEFILYREEMKGFSNGDNAYFEVNWTNFSPTHRQAPNHPFSRSRANKYPDFDLTSKRPPYEMHDWDRVDKPVRDDHHGVWPSFFSDTNELYFRLGTHQTWVSYTTLNSSNFWNEKTNDAVGIFIDRNDGWDDYEYSLWATSLTLQVRYFYKDGLLSWRWPLANGRRSTGLLAYDHAKDIKAVETHQELYRKQEGHYILDPRADTSHTQYLQNRYGYLCLDYIKEYVLDYGSEKRRQKNLFTEKGQINTADDLEKHIFSYKFFMEAGTNGARVDTGHSAVFTRTIYTTVSDAYVRLYDQMTPKQKQRITAMLLLMGYQCASEDFMPMRTMFGGNPNFHSDTKSVVGLMTFLFPEHPHIKELADIYDKYLNIATRYFTRPTKDEWNTKGGRWAENLGGYVWVAWRPLLRSASVSRDYFDGRNRVAKPGVVELGDWLVNAVGAPAPPTRRRGRDGSQSENEDDNPQGQTLTRVYPPQGAHGSRRIPPKDVWLLGSMLHNYAPLKAEHMMYTGNFGNNSSLGGESDPWQSLVFRSKNAGTNPHLKSSKYTGYGVILRAAVDTPDELSIHLQQIDDGPNYRWGSPAEGGNGQIYFYAAGKAYTHNGSEDSGDRRTQDTDINTNLGVWRDQRFMAIGKNFLTRPLYNLGVAQFAEIRAREGRDAAYSWPDYKSRSILLSGADYFVVYDDVYSGQVRTRFSWFTGIREELPFFHWVRGGISGNRGGRSPGAGYTKIETEVTKGFWAEGSNDSMVVVTHKPGLEVKATNYGAYVKGTNFIDQVYRDEDGINYKEGARSFIGTSGILRERNGVKELAIFNGTQIGAEGFNLSVSHSELGVSAIFTRTEEITGITYTEKPGTLTLEWSGTLPSGAVYIDGAKQNGMVSGNSITINIPTGEHRWQFTSGYPIPNAPTILRTENMSGGAKVFFTEVASATGYQFEISHDSGKTWTGIGSSSTSPHLVSGLKNGEKVHIRVIALNSQHKSSPSDEYPIYVSKDAPPTPDGLATRIDRNRVDLTWGEVLGVKAYQLYRRKKGETKFTLVYKGLNPSFTDNVSGIVPAFSMPGSRRDIKEDVESYVIYEYAITAVNDNGESKESATVDTDPSSWRNWDPTNWERFKYEYVNLGYRDGMYVIEPNNPGKVRYIE
jgi:hypothetical protein